MVDLNDLKGNTQPARSGPGQPPRPADVPDDTPIQWIPGRVGNYAVSKAGHVISAKRTPKTLTHQTEKGKSPRVKLYADGNQQTVRVARLVLRTFVGAPPVPEAAEIRFLNGDHTDVRLGNLEWINPDAPEYANAKDETLAGIAEYARWLKEREDVPLTPHGHDILWRIADVCEYLSQTKSADIDAERVHETMFGPEGDRWDA